MSYVKQLIVGAAANIGATASGMALGYSAIALPAMQSATHQPHVTESQASWIASMISVGMPMGCLVMGPLLDGLGRRRTLMLVNVPSVLGWLLLAIASHNEPWFLYEVYAGRILTGLATGLVSTPAVVYSGEVLDKTIRGVVVTWPSLFVSLGVITVYILGAIFPDDWRLVAWICFVFPVASIVAVWYFVPESPVWLIAHGHNKEAELSVRRIRNIPSDQSLPDDLQQELNDMKYNISHDDSSNSWRDTFTFLRKPEAYKPLIIFTSFFFFQQFSGIYVVMLYAVNIVRETGIKADSYTVTILVGVARLVMAIVISYASRRIGRRFLCQASGVGTSLSLAALALFLTMMHDGTISQQTAEQYSLIPASALLMSVLMGSFGFLTLPFAMIGEVFPAKIRSSACGFTTFMATVFSFAAIKLFPDMRNSMGYHNMFTFYAAVVTVGTVLMYFYLPETRGKTLTEIEDHFRGGKKVVEDVRFNDKAAMALLLGSANMENMIVISDRDKR